MRLFRSTRICGWVAALIALAPPGARAAPTSLGAPTALAAPRALTAPPNAKHKRHASDERDPEPCDPIIPAVRRIDQYFQRHEVNGLVLDSRYVINATEAARLSVVPQLLAYAELYRLSPLRRLRRDIAERADFLLDRSAEFRSHSVFDGMLAYAFLEAFEATDDSRYLTMGTLIVDELTAMPRSEYVLNGGLMAALAFAKQFRVSGDSTAERLTHEILSGVPHYQHADGSFPHWCPCSTDIHYTGWMSTELILIQRLIEDPIIDPMLARMREFMEGRVGDDGVTRYQEPCDDYPGCVRYYYSIASGCDFDYDTRAFTNELGYNALIFDHFGSARYGDVMRFLGTLESRGTYADKWDFWPPADDPYYVWTTADTSVINTSLIFWSLASVLAGRSNPITDPIAWIPDEQDGVIGGVGSPLRITPPEAPVERVAPDERAALWSTVDRLLLAGADPHGACGDPARSGATGGGTGDRAVRRGGPRSAPIESMRRAGGEPASSAAALRAPSVVPNPARENCTVHFTVPATARVTVAIYDLAGRSVRSLISEQLAAGDHAVRWDRRDGAGRSCRAGLYLALVRSGGEVRATRVLLAP